MLPPKVIIIILNWNNYPDTERCLDSLKTMTYRNYQVILYDNGSTDDSVIKLNDYIKRNPCFPLTLIENNNNLGFTKACNIGMDLAFGHLEADFVFLLNNDIEVTPGLLSEMVAKADDPKVGMVQPLMLQMADHSIIDSTGHTIRWGQVYDRGNGEVNRGQYTDNKHLIGASGAAALYRREMIADIGTFDKSYVSGFEDSELSWRAYKRGWKTEYAPNAVLYHKRSTTLNIFLQDPAFAAKFGHDAARPCKTHGTYFDRVLWMVPYFAIGLRSEIGMRLGFNKTGGGNYFHHGIEMLK